MGLFGNKRIPTGMDEFEINQRLQSINYYNDVVKRGDNITGFFNDVEGLRNTVKELVRYERKYPNYFNPKPSQILNNFSTNKLILEKGFIERYIIAIERKLLDYSTMRGKTNNFNKMVDIFRYYAGEFEPENVNYFEMKLRERFPEFLQ